MRSWAAAASASRRVAQKKVACWPWKRSVRTMSGKVVVGAARRDASSFRSENVVAAAAGIPRIARGLTARSSGCWRAIPGIDDAEPAGEGFAGDRHRLGVAVGIELAERIAEPEDDGGGGREIGRLPLPVSWRRSARDAGSRPAPAT